MSEAITAASVSKVLSRVTDPEVGINIVDLGLIYEVLLSEDQSQMQVRMTMTTPACPMGSHISDEVRAALSREWPSLQQVEVELVWEPPWSTDRLSDEARQQLGWNNN